MEIARFISVVKIPNGGLKKADIRYKIDTV